MKDVKLSAVRLSCLKLAATRVREEAAESLKRAQAAMDEAESVLKLLAAVERDDELEHAKEQS